MRYGSPIYWDLYGFIASEWFLTHPQINLTIFTSSTCSLLSPSAGLPSPPPPPGLLHFAPPAAPRPSMRYGTMKIMCIYIEIQTSGIIWPGVVTTAHGLAFEAVGYFEGVQLEELLKKQKMLDLSPS